MSDLDPPNPDDLHDMWADAHVSYSSPTGPDTSCLGVTLAEQAATWHARLTETAPNGSLLVHNSMFDTLTNSDVLHLLHVTHSLDRITRHGTLRPSGGCLVGSVYCAPLTSTGDGLRMHNLADYILTEEAPTAVARSPLPGRVPSPLIVEITLPRRCYRGLSGIDYLRLGPIHLRNYLDREFLLGPRERCALHEAVLSRVKNAADFLHLAASIAAAPEPAEHEAFPRLLAQAIPQLPVLGYIYFEALSEYLMLYSRSPQTRRLAELGEFNNRLSKQLLFTGFPGTASHFDLAHFRLDFTRLDEFLARIDPSIEAAHARRHLTARISYLTAARLLGPEAPSRNWNHIRWTFGHAARFFGPLLGHLIHRQLRRFSRYPDFYHFYDQDKAFQAWNYWNQIGIALPFNGTLPKGEVGINPAFPDLRYRVWKAELGEDRLLHPTEELELRLTPRLVGTQHTLMRDRRTSGMRSVRLDDRTLTDSSI
ncbi:hypothetical protein [Streptomyces sp. NPDC047097]|uniref:hypothetical protein n=1 Tax=Streptomyces sp. NPDC047097 TaxID=3155260 RepID=UPI003409FDB9